jgi:hypothetical protein
MPTISSPSSKKHEKLLHVAHFIFAACNFAEHFPKNYLRNMWRLSMASSVQHLKVQFARTIQLD